MDHHENDDSINALRRSVILATGLKAFSFALGLFQALKAMGNPAVHIPASVSTLRDDLARTDDVAVIKAADFKWTVARQVTVEEEADVVVHSNDGFVGFITKGAYSGTIVDLGRMRQRQEREGSLP